MESLVQRAHPPTRINQSSPVSFYERPRGVHIGIPVRRMTLGGGLILIPCLSQVGTCLAGVASDSIKLSRVKVKTYPFSLRQTTPMTADILFTQFRRL